MCLTRAAVTRCDCERTLLEPSAILRLRFDSWRELSFCMWYSTTRHREIECVRHVFVIVREMDAQKNRRYSMNYTRREPFGRSSCRRFVSRTLQNAVTRITSITFLIGFFCLQYVSSRDGEPIDARATSVDDDGTRSKGATRRRRANDWNRASVRVKKCVRVGASGTVTSRARREG